MFARVDFQVGLFYYSIGVDQERVAGGKLFNAEVYDRAILLGDFVVGVGEELEVETFFGAELLVGIGGVDADAQDYCTLILILG